MKTTAISIFSAAALSIGAAVALPLAATAAPTLGVVDGPGLAGNPDVTKVANSCNRNPGGSRNKYSGVYCPNPARAGKPGFRRVKRCTPLYKTRVKMIHKNGRVYKRKTRIVIGQYCRGVKPRS